MKKILFAAVFLLCVPSFLMAQEEEDWSILVKYSGQRPTITDFVSAFLTPEDIGESLGEMSGNWNLYLAGKALPKDHSFVVDTKNGYVRYDVTFPHEEGEYVYHDFIEFCYWNCADGKHKIVAQNTVSTQDGVPFMGQYTGLSFFQYDNSTRRMVPVYSGDLGIDVEFPEDAEWFTNKLPQTGKTIEYLFHSPSGETRRSFTWNGSKFVED